MSDVSTGLLSWLVKRLVQGYRWFVSPLLGPRCRFAPSCSEYCLEAIDRHGLRSGLKLTAARLARCHPWGSSGYDPVPAIPPCSQCKISTVSPLTGSLLSRPWPMPTDSETGSDQQKSA